MNKDNQYKAKVKEFNNGKIKIREYQSLMTIPKDKTKNSGSPESQKRILRANGEITKRSLSRTRQTLIELVENNEDRFKSFITLTYKEDIENISEAYSNLQSYIRSCKRNFPDFCYVAVPEIQHHRAKKTCKYVIHFHIITNAPVGSKLIPEREPKQITGADFKGTKTITYYDVEYWNKGFSIALPIIQQGEFELSKYLLKYLYKDLDNRFYGRQKLLHSNNLKAPEFNYYLNADEIKEENKKDIQEVYSLLEGETQYPFIDYIYKKDKV